jgi:hypothetical protein
MNKRMLGIFALLLCAATASAHPSFFLACEEILVKFADAAPTRHSMQRGQKVTLEFEFDSPKGAYFLGKLDPSADRPEGALVFIEELTDTFHFVSPRRAKLEFNRRPLDSESMPLLVEPISQTGGTCAAEATHSCMLLFDDYLRSHNLGLPRTNEYATSLWREVREIAYSPHTDDHESQISRLRSFFNKVGIPNTLIRSVDGSFKEKVVKQLESGGLVHLGYRTDGWDEKVYLENLHEFSTSRQASSWQSIARPSGKGKPGHAVLAVAAVPARNGSTRLIILDSNHKRFVVWDAKVMDDWSKETQANIAFLLGNVKHAQTDPLKRVPELKKVGTPMELHQLHKNPARTHYGELKFLTTVIKGEVELKELAPGYFVYAIRDQNHVHWIDPARYDFAGLSAAEIDRSQLNEAIFSKSEVQHNRFDELKALDLWKLQWEGDQKLPLPKQFRAMGGETYRSLLRHLAEKELPVTVTWTGITIEKAKGLVTFREGKSYVPAPYSASFYNVDSFEVHPPETYSAPSTREFLEQHLQERSGDLARLRDQKIRAEAEVLFMSKVGRIKDLAERIKAKGTEAQLVWTHDGDRRRVTSRARVEAITDEGIKIQGYRLVIPYKNIEDFVSVSSLWD